MHRSAESGTHLLANSEHALDGQAETGQFSGAFGIRTTGLVYMCLLPTNQIARKLCLCGFKHACKTMAMA